MKTVLQEVIARGYPALAEKTALPPHVHRAARAMVMCRTSALGGHIQGCPEGHVQRVWYNSCRHRSCPQCNRIQLERWLEGQKSRLIDHPHRHMIFTLPHELHPYWRRNTDQMTRWLFQSVRETLLCFLTDPAYLGAQPGILSVLHTWGRALTLHPHIHCAITEGGLDDRGQWRLPVKNCFLPIRAVMFKYRGHFLAQLKAAVDRGELALPEGETPTSSHNLFNRLGRKLWNVNLRERYDNAEGVVEYLARYVRGGPMRPSQLSKFRADQNDVLFRYHAHRDNPDGGRKRCRKERLSAGELTGRLLQHVPRKGLNIVRSYGLYAVACRGKLDQARAEVGQAPVRSPKPVQWQGYLGRFPGSQSQAHCSVCERQLMALAPITPSRAPP